MFLYIKYPRSCNQKMKDYTFPGRTLTELRELRYVDVRLGTLRIEADGRRWTHFSISNSD